MLDVMGEGRKYVKDERGKMVEADVLDKERARRGREEAEGGNEHGL